MAPRETSRRSTSRCPSVSVRLGQESCSVRIRDSNAGQPDCARRSSSDATRLMSMHATPMSFGTFHQSVEAEEPVPYAVVPPLHELASPEAYLRYAAMHIASRLVPV